MASLPLMPPLPPLPLPPAGRLVWLVSGRTVYFGPAAEASAYLSSQGFSCPPSFNPADFVLDLVSLDLRSPDLEASEGPTRHPHRPPSPEPACIA